MLEPWVIEQIKKQEKEKETRPEIQLPLDDDFPQEKPKEPSDGYHELYRV